MNSIFDPSLVLYLPLYELDGASIRSKDAYGHLATITGALWTPQGRSFDGTDDLINVPDTAVLDPTTALTVIVWAYSTGAVAKFLAAKRIQGSASAWNLSTGIIFDIWISGVVKEVISNSAMTQNQWGYVAGVYNNTDLRIYRNGVLDCTPVLATGSIDNTADPVRIGWGYADTYGIIGKVGEVQIYNRALTALEIQHNYLSSKWRYQ